MSNTKNGRRKGLVRRLDHSTSSISDSSGSVVRQYLVHYYSISYTTTVAGTLLSLPILGFVSYSNVVSNLIWQQQICLMKL
ncbi:hypothetical protein EB796_009925 [Bugula neritina]|uniref:Uncharacterized protein n=1 Tax=Bugula neritina TaxID=10212 RepID=A0A7J7K2D9_BUGNE|nr:hypothetical protein EB796_009925 [Bugula neritina]